MVSQMLTIQLTYLLPHIIIRFGAKVEQMNGTNRMISLGRRCKETVALLAPRIGNGFDSIMGAFMGIYHAQYSGHLLSLGGCLLDELLGGGKTFFYLLQSVKTIRFFHSWEGTLGAVQRTVITVVSAAQSRWIGVNNQTKYSRLISSARMWMWQRVVVVDSTRREHRATNDDTQRR